MAPRTTPRPASRPVSGPASDPIRSAVPDEGLAAEPLSRVLRALPEEEGLALGDLLAPMGSRAHGLSLLLLALPEAIPLPVPSASAVLGVPLVAVAAHLALFGEGSRLPRGVERRRVPARLLRLLRRRVAPALERAERLSRPRWAGVAGRERLIGLVSLHLALLLLLPLPLVNAPPALCIVLLAWGMMRRDGAFVAAGIAGAALLTAALGAVALWLVAAIA